MVHGDSLRVWQHHDPRRVAPSIRECSTEVGACYFRNYLHTCCCELTTLNVLSQIPS